MFGLHYPTRSNENDLSFLPLPPLSKVLSLPIMLLCAHSSVQCTAVAQRRCENLGKLPSVCSVNQWDE